MDRRQARLTPVRLQIPSPGGDCVKPMTGIDIAICSRNDSRLRGAAVVYMLIAGFLVMPWRWDCIFRQRMVALAARWHL